MCLLFPSFTLIFPWIAIDTSSGSNFRGITFRLPFPCYPCGSSVICIMWRDLLFSQPPNYFGQAVKTFNITSEEHIEAIRNDNSDSVYYRVFTPPLGRDNILLDCMSFSLFGPVSISSAVSFLSVHLSIILHGHSIGSDFSGAMFATVWTKRLSLHTRIEFDSRRLYSCSGF
jgi:hypothetical protein